MLYSFHCEKWCFLIFLSEISSFVCCFSNNGTSSPRAWRSYQHCRWQRLPPRSGGETSHQHHRCDPKQQQYLFAVQKWNYLQIQNFLASFNFELHHLHVTRTWTTTYDFKNIFLVGDNQKNISFSIYSRDHHLLLFPPVRTFSSSRNLAEDRNPSYLTDIKFYQCGVTF